MVVRVNEFMMSGGFRCNKMCTGMGIVRGHNEAEFGYFRGSLMDRSEIRSEMDIR